MTEVMQLEEQLKMYKDMANKFDKLQKLMKNREFKELILEDYLNKEPARLTSLLAHTEHREAAVGELMAISRFGQHLQTCEMMFEQAKAQVAEIENELAEVRKEA